jgi:hypothetical protein
MSETGEVKEEAPVSNLRLYEQLELNKAKKEEGTLARCRMLVAHLLLLFGSLSTARVSEKVQGQFRPAFRYAPALI